MRRRSLWLIVLPAVGAWAGAASGGVASRSARLVSGPRQVRSEIRGIWRPVHPTVVPSRGRIRTVFVVKFTSHARLGRRPTGFYEYDRDVSESGRNPAPGCEGGLGDAITRGQPGEKLRFVERPSSIGGLGIWCVGRYRATITLMEQGPCMPSSGLPCRPLFIRKVIVGRTRWTVQAISKRS